MQRPATREDAAMAFLIANALVWNGETDDRYPAEVLIERNRITAVARGHGQIQRTASRSSIELERCLGDAQK